MIRWACCFLLIAVTSLDAQVCRLNVAGLNRNRRVVGDVSAECPAPLHTAPFGNWGATSNFGSKRDGHQFDGWCHNQRICDNLGNCRDNCSDTWYEWNSCTTHSLYRGPNCTLYNSADCTEQVSTTGVNVLGTQTVDIAVSCPSASNRVSGFDRGGCSEVRSYSRDNNYMSLYELDPLTGDELVQSVYFPGTSVSLDCNVWGCASATSEFVGPISWDSPKTPAKIFAEMGMIVNSGSFVDSSNRCQLSPISLWVVSSATRQVAPLAPESMVTLHTASVTGEVGVASSSTLPTALGGIQVRVTENGGAPRLAGLSFVSPHQINFVIPPGLREGPATVSVVAGSSLRATGSIEVAKTSPGLFTADGSGRGIAAAMAMRIDPQGGQHMQRSYSCAEGFCVGEQLHMGASEDQFILVLYGTGIRGGQTTTATIGGMPAEVIVVSAQPTNPGLDQVNVRVPRSLAGAGLVEVALDVDGKASNTVVIALQ
jgi:uncharacterized protein (TIGR03437 family)